MSAINACLRRWRLFALLPAVLAVAAVGLTLLKSDTYTARAAFTPQGGSAVSPGVTGLAQSFGLSLPGGRSTDSPAFYGLLLRSDGLLRELTRRPWVAEEGADSASLASLFGVAEEEPAGREAATVDGLRDRVVVNVSEATGVVTVDVKTRWPLLSDALAKALIAKVHEFNLDVRQTRGRAEREFTERRLEEARIELERADDALAGFLAQNRRIGSPELLAEQRRLQSRVDFRQIVYTSLAQALEQARIEEVRNTAVITLVDESEVPARPDPNHIVAVGLLAILLGLVLAVAWSLTAEWWRAQQAVRPEAREMGGLARAIATDLRRGPRGWLGR